MSSSSASSSSEVKESVSTAIESVGSAIANAASSVGHAVGAVASGVAEAMSGAAAATWKPLPHQLQWQNLAWSNSGKQARSDTSWANVVELDGFDAAASDVAKYKSQGKLVIGYLSVGTQENWRPDSSSFPAAVLGGKLDGWQGERWLKMSQWKLLQPIMTKRFQMLKTKGFDGFEGDNTDVYEKEKVSGSKANGLAYCLWLANTAHSMGLSAVFKNTLDLVPDVVKTYDAIVNEECQQYSECNALKPFADAGKAVWEVEYSGKSKICSKRSAFVSTLLYDDPKGYLRCPF